MSFFGSMYVKTDADVLACCTCHVTCTTTTRYNNLSGNLLCGGSTSIGVTEEEAAKYGSYATNNVVGSC